MAWTEQSLAKHFFDAASSHAQKAGRTFGDGADNDLHILASTGAHKLLASVKPEEIDAAVQLATADIKRLIDMAIEVARGLTDYDQTKLGERTYFPAKFRFCPCSPFC